MGKELKVLMMGGARVGKSSALAAIMDSFVHGEISRFLTASDKTHLVEKNGKKQTSIEGKLQDILYQVIGMMELGLLLRIQIFISFL